MAIKRNQGHGLPPKRDPALGRDALTTSQALPEDQEQSANEDRIRPQRLEITWVKRISRKYWVLRSPLPKPAANPSITCCCMAPLG